MTRQPLAHGPQAEDVAAEDLVDAGRGRRAVEPCGAIDFFEISCKSVHMARSPALREWPRNLISGWIVVRV